MNADTYLPRCVTSFAMILTGCCIAAHGAAVDKPRAEPPVLHLTYQTTRGGEVEPNYELAPINPGGYIPGTPVPTIAQWIEGVGKENGGLTLKAALLEDVTAPGYPIELQLVARNVDSTTVKLLMSNPRNDYILRIEGPDGKVKVIPSSGLAFSCGIADVPPGSDVRDHYPLDTCYSFQEPGTYRITAARGIVQRENKGVSYLASNIRGVSYMVSNIVVLEVVKGSDYDRKALHEIRFRKAQRIAAALVPGTTRSQVEEELPWVYSRYDDQYYLGYDVMMEVPYRGSGPDRSKNTVSGAVKIYQQSMWLGRGPKPNPAD
jgi:hypothetical protein